MVVFNTLITNNVICGISSLRRIDHKDSFTFMNTNAHKLAFDILTQSYLVVFESKWFSWSVVPDGRSVDLLIKNLETDKEYHEFIERYCDYYAEVSFITNENLPDHIHNLRKNNSERLKEANKRLLKLKPPATPTDN